MKEQLGRDLPITWKAFLLEQVNSRRGDEWKAFLKETEERHPFVLVGSYPSFEGGVSEVEVVLKSSDAAELAAAVAWIEPALEQATG